MKLSRRELFKMAVVTAPSVISAIRAQVKLQPVEQVSTEGAMTLARYDDDDFILQIGYSARGRDVSDLQFPIRRPGLASMIEPKRGLFIKKSLV